MNFFKILFNKNRLKFSNNYLSSTSTNYIFSNYDFNLYRFGKTKNLEFNLLGLDSTKIVIYNVLDYYF